MPDDKDCWRKTPSTHPYPSIHPSTTDPIFNSLAGICPFRESVVGHSRRVNNRRPRLVFFCTAFHFWACGRVDGDLGAGCGYTLLFSKKIYLEGSYLKGSSFLTSWEAFWHFASTLGSYFWHLGTNLGAIFAPRD